MADQGQPFAFHLNKPERDNGIIDRVCVGKFGVSALDSVEAGFAQAPSNVLIGVGGSPMRMKGMSSFGKRTDGPTGRRWIKRKRVGLTGSALFMGGSRSVLITDLSLSGGRMTGNNLPAAGARVLITVGDQSLLGQIAWARNDERGVAFEFGRRG